jgi:hypothetical protein
MPKKAHTEEQIVAVLQQVEAGARVDDICRKVGIIRDPCSSPQAIVVTAMSARMDDAFLLDKWRLTKDGREITAMPRLALIRSILLNHSYHHRGQLSVYLRMVGVPVPSIYGPSADESPWA